MPANKYTSITIGKTAKVIHPPALPLAAMYLEEALNHGLAIEIPSLGVTISRHPHSHDDRTVPAAAMSPAATE